MIISVEDNGNFLILGLILNSDEEVELSVNSEDKEFDFFNIILDVDIDDSKFDVSKDIFDDEINEFNDCDIILSSDNGTVL
jgi:hypothetical protein